jgi:mannose-1-phosphate guanylyltransferase
VEWRDVGSWPSLGEIVEACGDGNRVMPGTEATLVGCRDCFVMSDDGSHHVAMLGVEGLVVVHTGKSTLVMSAARAEELRALHEEIPDAFR